jgi:hypothetical protein
MEVIGLSNDIFLVTVRVRRSHHLITRKPVPQPRRGKYERKTSNNPLDNPVFSTTHTGILVEPHYALDCTIVRQATALS